MYAINCGLLLSSEVDKGVHLESIEKHLNDESGLNFAIQSYHREEVISLLPILYKWSLAFQQPPYSFAGFHQDDIIDSQDIMYVNDKNALVVIAKIDECIVGIGAGLPFDSSYVRFHFEKTQLNFYETVANKGYDVSKLFYITFILMAPDYRDNRQLPNTIFEEFSRFAIGLGQTGICRMEDRTLSSKDPIETWVSHVDGFKKMGISFNKNWLTYAEDGSVQEREHHLEFFLKKF